MRGRLPVLLLAAFAVAIAFAGSRGRDESPARETADRIPAGAVRVPFVYSPEKQRPARSADRALQRRAPPGRRAPGVRGGPVDELRRGRDEDPRRRSEARRVVARLVLLGPAARVRGRSPARARGECRSLVRTPVVIAMWEPMARALGWPRKKLGFADFVRLARSGAGWGDFGHPEWGAFKLVHTNPDFSTSGLSAVVAEYFFATGKREGLTERDVTDPRARGDRPRPRALDRPLRREHAADRAADAPARAGLRLGRRDGGDHPARLQPQARRPAAARGDLSARGDLLSDNPYIVLDADWVTPEQRRGAEALQHYLTRALTPEVAAKEGFRPADVGTPPVGAGGGGQRGGPGPARARADRARPRGCWRGSSSPGARTASPPTSCSSSTSRDRWARTGGSSRRSGASARSWTRRRARTASA